MVAGAMAVLLVAGAAYFRFHKGPAAPVRWDPRVTSIVQFVEKERGLKFVHPVAVEFLPANQFVAKIGNGNPTSAQNKVELEHTVGEMRALGLVTGDADLAAMSTQESQQSVIGLYVPHDKRIYVKGADLTPFVRVTLAHELTHALQDQHVDLQRLLALKSADHSAVLALVEGDAVRVEDAYAKSLSAQDQAAYQSAVSAQAGGQDLKGVSPFLIDQASLPYVFGPVFVEALVQSGGTAAIDRALAAPPTVDAQIVDPNRYLIQQAVTPVPSPLVPRGATKLGPSSTFGLVTMLEVIAPSAGYQPAWSALQNWRGDRTVDYLQAGVACIAVATAFDSPAHATDFVNVSQKWLAGKLEGSVTASGSTVDLRACDPGPGAKPVVASPSPFEVLSLRATLMTELFTEARPPADVAACMADWVIGAAGPQTLISVSGPNDPRYAQITQDVAKAAVACGYTGPQSGSVN